VRSVCVLMHCRPSQTDDLELTAETYPRQRPLRTTVEAFLGILMYTANYGLCDADGVLYKLIDCLLTYTVTA